MIELAQTSYVESFTQYYVRRQRHQIHLRLYLLQLYEKVCVDNVIVVEIFKQKHYEFLEFEFIT